MLGGLEIDRQWKLSLPIHSYYYSLLRDEEFCSFRFSALQLEKCGGSADMNEGNQCHRESLL